MARTTPVNAGYTIINGTGTGSNGNRIDVWLEYKVTSQSVVDNTSQITAVFYAALRSGYASQTWGSSGRSSTVTIDGSAASFSGGYDFRTTAVNALGSQTRTIAHSADGSRQITLSGSFTTRSTYISGGSVSGTIALPTIPRATTPVISIVTLGSPATVTLSPASDGFTHSMWYRYGSMDWVSIVSGATAKSVSFTVPLSYATYAPSSASVALSLMCETYNGGAYVGGNTISFTAAIPDSVTPTVTGITISEATSGLEAQFGAYVQGKSRLKIAIAATGAYGSSVTSYKTSIAGVTYTGAEHTTDTIASVGSLPITATVTDTRGRTGSMTTYVSVTAYANPYISSLTAQRCDAAGTLSEDGDYAIVSLSGGVSPVSDRNTAAYRVKYKASGAADYTTHAFPQTEYRMSGTVILPMSSNLTYEVVAEAQDFFTTTQQTVTVPTAEVIFDVRADGKGLAFGKVSERDGIEIAADWPLKIWGALAIESGGSGATTAEEALANLGIPVERGLWTPVFRDYDGIVITKTDIFNYAAYWRIGRLCFLLFTWRGSITNLNGATSYASIGGLPFPVGSGDYRYGMTVSFHREALRDTSPVVAVEKGNNLIRCLVPNGVDSNAWVKNNGTQFLSFTGWYEIE